ncbi:MAG: hypothetical protein ACJA0H_000494 [Francisellaceae bacterium]|jgi:hypothetical protein
MEQSKYHLGINKFTRKDSNCMNDHDQVWISFQLPKEISEKLVEYCSENGRSKRVEARMRLIDHILRYPHIKKIGAVESDENILT